ncbi:hypothetical protein ACIHDR_02875 [Nocardia sp. NPDC052278]|uniref:hypothetical protein n=1 Tax=unclassified Nocardia TaxID=2637762 RepID=UPI0036B5A752
MPISVICELLGVPDADKDEFRAWSAILVDDSADIEKRTSACLSFFTYLTDLIAERSEHPLDDLLSELIVAKDDDDRLDQQELISMLFLLLTALARMEATIAVTRLLARIPAMSLDVPATDLTWRKSLLIRGLTPSPSTSRPPPRSLPKPQSFPTQRTRPPCGPNPTTWASHSFQRSSQPQSAPWWHPAPRNHNRRAGEPDVTHRLDNAASSTADSENIVEARFHRSGGPLEPCHAECTCRRDDFADDRSAVGDSGGVPRRACAGIHTDHPNRGDSSFRSHLPPLFPARIARKRLQSPVTISSTVRPPGAHSDSPPVAASEG